MLSNNTLISVIVPVYNVKNYLTRCVRSILGQSFRFIELLLIDDGSSDGSAELCDEFAREDCRVIVRHKENEGVSKARNLGLELARGEYVAFVDSDDFIENDFLKVLYESARMTGADVVSSSWAELSGDESLKPIKKYVLQRKVISDYNDILKDYCDMKAYGATVWGKLIRRDLIGDARFSKLRYGEDTLFMMSVLQNAHKVCLEPYMGYNYIRWTDSATIKIGKANLNREFDILELYHELFQISLKYNSLENINRMVAIYVNKTCIAIFSMISLKEKEAYRSGKKDMVLNSINEIRGYNISRKGKSIFSLYKHFPKILWGLYRCKLRFLSE